MVKALLALAKYLTWWFIKPLVSRWYVANLTHMLQTSSFNQTHVLVVSNNISLFCLEGRIYIITLLNPLPVLILLNPSPVLVALKTLRDILSFTRSLMINTRSPARWVSRKLRPKSKTIPCYTAECFKSSCLLFVDTMSLVLQRDSRFVSRNCHATDIVLAELGSNGF